jgi:hypothetical protein
MLAAAALDRLLHRGVIVGIDGPSYRMRAHQHRADVIRKAAAGTSHPLQAPLAPGPPQTPQTTAVTWKLSSGPWQVHP